MSSILSEYFTKEYLSRFQDIIPIGAERPRFPRWGSIDIDYNKCSIYLKESYYIHKDIRLTLKNNVIEEETVKYHIDGNTPFSIRRPPIISTSRKTIKL